EARGRVMHIRWFGQSTFLISGERTVFTDPFADMDGLAERGLRFDYRAIERVEADLLPVTHEHVDHNAGEVIGGSPVTLRSTPGGESAAAIVRALRPRLVIPMHYRTEAVNFLGPPDEFLAALGARVERLNESELEVEQLLGTAEDPTVALLAPPS